MTSKDIKEIVRVILEKLDIKQADFNVDRPTDTSHGDYSTNAAMVLAKDMGKSPKAVAEMLVDAFKNMKDDFKYIEKIEIAGPGFINFFLTKECFSVEIETILREKNVYGMQSMYEDQRVLIEHSSPNLFKAFHVGHVMNNTIGEAICGLARYSGAKVTAMSYPSDISLGIAKAIWALLADGGIDKLKTFESTTEEVAYLGECYVRGTNAYEEDKSQEPRIKEISAILYSKQTDTLEYQTYVYAKERNLQFFRDITSRLGSHFDDFIFESEAGVEGEKIVRENIGKVFEESEGAVVYKGEQDGLHTRVFINKEGHPTYEAKDVGLMSLKFKKYSPDISIFVTDNQQAPYFEVVVNAAGKINKVWQDKTIHRTHGRMTFKGQKLSSRLGGVTPAGELLDAVIEEVKIKSPDLNSSLFDEIAIAALKFAILRVAAGKNMNFDPDTSLSFEGDSGPYLQYTAVRAGSVLEKAGTYSISSKYKDDTITHLERSIIHYKNVLDASISTWSPHHVAIYLLSLAQEFNSWYAATRILDTENENMPYNLALTQATQTVLTNGLTVLGIKVPMKM